MPLTITIPANDDLWDADNNRFISVKEQTLVLEHSLISLSKWERITKIPFLSNATENKLTPEQWLLYIKCMTINQVNDMAYGMLTQEMYEKVFAYINDPMTATTINDNRPNKGRREIITSEVIYYQMISYGIPIELEKWHLNNLMTLITVFSVKGAGEKKMSRAEAAAYQRSLNESRIRKGKKR